MTEVAKYRLITLSPAGCEVFATNVSERLFCLFARISKKKLYFELNQIFDVCRLWPRLDYPVGRLCDMCCTSGFVDDGACLHIIARHMRATRKKTNAKSDSPSGSTEDTVWCLRLPCCVHIDCIVIRFIVKCASVVTVHAMRTGATDQYAVLLGNDHRWNTRPRLCN